MSGPAPKAPPAETYSLITPERRIVRRPVAAAATDLGVHPVLARIYAGRGVRSAAEVDYSLARLLPCDGLHGIAKAVALLVRAIEEGARILIVADFDADGATACAVAVRGLEALGAADVRFLVPNRFEFGYGLTPEIVAVAARQRPDLLVTVDNGIASVEGVAAARAAGMRVLITDHHLPGPQLPEADAIVDPNLPCDGFASKHLCGVGVMFYLLLALRAELRGRGGFAARPEPRLAELLNLVALGTVADVVPLDHNNRILVHQGLARIRAGRGSAGVQALLTVAGRRCERLVASDLGFALGPRLNAAGRLADMSLGIACLLCDDPAGALEMAGRLDGLNRERRGIEARMQAEALEHLGALSAAVLDDAAALCVYREDWHPGVVGILAARLRDRFHRPVVAFAPGLGEDIRGSARSVPGLHIRDVLATVAARHPGLVMRFGGHATAAGVCVQRGELEAFRAAFDHETSRHLSPEDRAGVLYTDGALEPSELTLEVAEALRRAGPWGQGFAEPLFDGEFEVLAARPVGERHLKLRVRAREAGGSLEAMAFNAHGAAWAAEGESLRLAYRLEVSDYGGLSAPQLVVEHAEPAAWSATGSASRR
jgi:single-stranded-DNA-specific exonuclease